MAESTRSSKGADPRVWVTVLAGGVGSRFWPVSTPSRPKQLLPLASERPIVADTVHRARALVPAERIRVLAGADVGARILEAVSELLPECLMVEPRARGTGPVLAWAAWHISRADPDAVLISLHSDHVIRPLGAFQSVMQRAVEIAVVHQGLVTVGVAPTRPETGYGYVRPGERLAGEGPAAYRVVRFVEKPDLGTARRYMGEGYLWNSGIFVWQARTFLDVVARVAPEIGAHLGRLEGGDDGGFFEAVSAASVDEAVLEKSERVFTVRAQFEWDDLGSWESLARSRTTDEEGNVTIGDALVVEGSGNIAFAEAGSLVLFGTRDLVAVRTGDVTLVAPRERTADLKTLLARLPERLRSSPKAETGA